MKKPASLTVLDDIRVESPCQESWAGMSGDAQRRFCARCKHSVNNISEMTREEAAAVIASTEPGRRVCVRFRRDDSGQIVFKPARGVSPSILRRAAMIAFGVLSFMRLSGYAQAEDVEQGDVAVPPAEQRQIMGEMQIPTNLPTPAPTAAPKETLPCHTMGAISIAPRDTKSKPAPEIMGKVAAPRR